MLEPSEQTEELARRLASQKAQPVDEIVRRALEAIEKTSVQGTGSSQDGWTSTRRAALDRAIDAIEALP